MAKQLAFDAEARDAISVGVQNLSRAVGATLGPRGRNAMLDKGWGAPTVTKDGVSVAEEIEFADAYQNMGARLIREVASKTSDVAGDGTTTATVLAAALYREGLRHVVAGANAVELQRGMLDAAAHVVANLKKERKLIAGDKKMLMQVATVSANGDKEIGKIIAEALEAAGKDGVVTVEEGKGIEMEKDVVEGMQFDRGYLSPHFVTDADRMEAVLENPLILIHEEKISAVAKIVPLLEKVIKENRPLVIIAEDVEGEALATLVVNKLRGGLRVVAVKAPGYGDRRKAMLDDIATLTGAKPIMKDLGVDLEQVRLADLGTCRKIIVDAENTTIVEGRHKPADVQARVAQIRREVEVTTSDYDREKLQERLAKLAGGVAEIKVGAATETEMKEKKARVEDAYHATKAALDEGIVPGGGVALIRASMSLRDVKLPGDRRLGVEILRRALELPARTIAENAGLDGSVVVRNIKKNLDKSNYGYDAAEERYGDMVEFGVIDPTKVVRSALENAVSVAGVLLTTECLIATKPEKEDDDAGAGEGMDEDM
jgi:chaperonin GroEL